MRLVTMKRIYRAFPQLDEFSDARCERLLGRLRGEGRYWTAATLLAGTAFVLSFIVAIVLVFDFGSQLEWLARRVSERWDEQIYLFTALLLVLLPPPLAMLLVRDGVLWFHLHRALTRTIRLTSCRGCGYLLLGQRVLNNRIVCPECGQPTSLAELGLSSPEELIPPESGEDIQLKRMLYEEEPEQAEQRSAATGEATVRRLREVRDTFRTAEEQRHGTGKEPDA